MKLKTSGFLHLRIIYRISVMAAAVCTLMIASPCLAGYLVTLDTSPLNGMGIFYVEFQLTDGSGDGDANSQAIVSNFALTGGVLEDVLEPTFGNVTGSLVGALTLRDGPAEFGDLADFAQGFFVIGATSQMSFNLGLAATSVDEPFPDTFLFLILDSSFDPIPTDGPLGVEFVGADFTSTTPAPAGFSSTSPSLTAVVTTATGVPEPTTLTLLACELVGLVVLRLWSVQRGISGGKRGNPR